MEKEFCKGNCNKVELVSTYSSRETSSDQNLMRRRRDSSLWGVIQAPNIVRHVVGLKSSGQAQVEKAALSRCAAGTPAGLNG